MKMRRLRQSRQSAIREIKTLLLATLPVFMGYTPLGIVFGFLFTQQGADWWLAPLMSLLLFAGAAQFLAIGLLAANASLAEISLACLIVNLRHIVYGISVRKLLPKSLSAKLYCIYTLTDENYSLLTGLDVSYAEKNSFKICAINHFYWTFAAFIGAIIGKSAQINIPGLEFSLTALFTVLAIEQYRANKRPIMLIIVLFSYIISINIIPSVQLISAIFISILLTIFMEYFRLNMANKK
ncbi:MAG: AzlC family ABC transporter permease [Hyphomicrobiales bacterium]